MARSLKFRIKELEGLYYLYSKTKGADQLRFYHKADLRLCFLHMQKAGFLMTRLILCYRGTTKLSDTEVFALYDGTHVPLDDMNTFYGTVSYSYT